MRCRRQVGEDRRVLYRDLLLVVVAVRDPRLYLRAIERAGDELLMEWVLIVVARLTDGVEPVDEFEGCLSRRRRG